MAAVLKHTRGNQYIELAYPVPRLPRTSPITTTQRIAQHEKNKRLAAIRAAVLRSRKAP